MIGFPSDAGTARRAPSARGREGLHSPTTPPSDENASLPPPRRRLQPRPVAPRPRHGGRGLPPLPPRRDQLGLRRHLLLDRARARGGPLRVRLARRRDGPLRQARHGGRPRHALRRAPRVAGAEVPRGAAHELAGVDSARAQPLGWPPQPLLHVARLPREGAADRRGARRALRQAPRARGLAPLQRILRRVPLPALHGRVPGLAPRQVRLARRAQPRLVVRLLGPYLHGLEPDRAHRPVPRRARPRLEALRLRPDRRLRPLGGRVHPPAFARRPDHDEPDGVLRRPRLRARPRRSRRSSASPTTTCARSSPASRSS